MKTCWLMFYPQRWKLSYLYQFIMKHSIKSSYSRYIIIIYMSACVAVCFHCYYYFLQPMVNQRNAICYSCTLWLWYWQHQWWWISIIIIADLDWSWFSSHYEQNHEMHLIDLTSLSAAGLWQDVTIRSHSQVEASHLSAGWLYLSWGRGWFRDVYHHAWWGGSCEEVWCYSCHAV